MNDKIYEYDKTYEIFIPGEKYILFPVDQEPYAHAFSFWKSLGGIFYENRCDYIYGTDELLTEFILTYPYSQYLIIDEVTDDWPGLNDWHWTTDTTI